MEGELIDGFWGLYSPRKNLVNNIPAPYKVMLPDPADTATVREADYARLATTVIPDISFPISATLDYKKLSADRAMGNTLPYPGICEELRVYCQIPSRRREAACCKAAAQDIIFGLLA